MKRAIVLAGGGAKGSYQMGFWTAIRELGIDFQITTGSSVGALNAALLASGNYEGGLEMWSSITTEDIVTRTPSQLSQLIDTSGIAASLKGIMGDLADDAVNVRMDPFPLGGLINKFFSEKEIRDGHVELGIMTSEYPSLKSRPFTLAEIPFGMMEDYLLASSAVFPSMEPKEIAGTRYVDGGYSDNFPVNLALDMGAEEIIGVRLKASGLEAKYQTNYPVRIIEPHFYLGPAMTFDPAQAQVNMALGYNDTMRSFGEYEGAFYSFKKGETERMNNLFAKFLANIMIKCSCISVSERGEYFRALPVKALAEAQQRRFGRMKYELPLLAAETAGELYEVDPKPLYTIEEFGKAVLAAYLPAEETSIATVNTAFRNAKAIAYRMAALKEIDKRHIAAYIVHLLENGAGKPGADRELRALCRVAPQAFFGAIYISFLKKGGGV